MGDGFPGALPQAGIGRAVGAKSQHQLAHLHHRIGRVGELVELVELFKDGFLFHSAVFPAEALRR